MTPPKKRTAWRTRNEREFVRANAELEAAALQLLTKILNPPRNIVAPITLGEIHHHLAPELERARVFRLLRYLVRHKHLEATKQPFAGMNTYSAPL